MNVEKLTPIQLIFLQSKVNGAPYYGDQLPAWEWNWPRITWLRRTLKETREGCDAEHD